MAVAATLGGVLLARNAPESAVSSARGGADAAAAPSPAGAGSATQPKAVGGEQGPEFTAEQLPAQVRQLLAARPTAQLGSADSPAASVPACVLTAAGHPDEQPLGTGPGRYQGRTVLALVFRPAGGSGPLDVYLATPECPGSTILLHSTVPAP
ncbi:hypothetical protein [Kitasatospora cheerisanensis]|uniref:hypothetical protein n=1 Tax=Kitasatospora cheerisanensis TaxID=81942 RepID=UPI00055E6F50|nr:hypothetical protein [Kitasatospora cheerisanensis]